jgi:ABC-type multidrug transport system fused ATPase/permease subunit
MKFKILINLIKIYPQKTKLFFLLCFCSTILLSISELISIGIIIPIISLMISPQLLFYRFKLHFLILYFNLNTNNDIRIFVLITVFIVILLTTFLKIFLFKINTKFASHIGRKTSVLLVNKILKLKYSALNKLNVDHLLTLSSKNIEYYTYYIVLPFINLMSSIFQIIFFIFLLFYIDINISIITISFFTLIYISFNYFFKNKIKFNNNIIDESTPAILSNMRNVLNGFKEIQLYKKNDYYLSKFEQTFTKSFTAQSNSLYLISLPKYIIEAIALLFLIALLYYKITINDNLLSIIPYLTTFLLALQRLLPNFQLAFSSYTNIKTYSYVVKDILHNFNELDLNTDNIFVENKKDILKFENIYFKNIDFTYNNNDYIFRNFITKIFHGEKIFISGNSGSGKSTFIDLFCGFQIPTNGNIYINENYNLTSVLEDWRDNIAYIPQKVYIMNATYYENITLSDSFDNNKLDQIIKITKSCGLHDLIMQNKLGYNFKINSDFPNLSGGQLKRLAIARALYANKSILIFDEATSGLDVNSEKEIIDLLLNLGPNKTVLFISHNISMKYLFDKTLNFSK